MHPILHVAKVLHILQPLPIRFALPRNAQLCMRPIRAENDAIRPRLNNPLRNRLDHIHLARVAMVQPLEPRHLDPDPLLADQLQERVEIRRLLLARERPAEVVRDHLDPGVHGADHGRHDRPGADGAEDADGPLQPPEAGGDACRRAGPGTSPAPRRAR